MSNLDHFMPRCIYSGPFVRQRREAVPPAAMARGRGNGLRPTGVLLRSRTRAGRLCPALPGKLLEFAMDVRLRGDCGSFHPRHAQSAFHAARRPPLASRDPPRFPPRNRERTKHDEKGCPADEEARAEKS